MFVGLGITDTKFGRLVVRPDSGDPAETCTAILKRPFSNRREAEG